MSATLTGTYTRNMDCKGRVVMVAPFRETLGEPFVLTRAPERCLLALSKPQWKVLVERHRRDVAFRGQYLSQAVECKVDATTGRFMVPHYLRSYARLRPRQDVALAGIGHAVQLFNYETWKPQIDAGQFPGLAQLELDLNLPSFQEIRPYRQHTSYPAGVPVISCSGQIRENSLCRLARTVNGLSRTKAPAVLLDLREVRDAAFILPQLPPTITPLWVIGARNPEATNIRQFDTVEEAFFALPERRTR